MNEHLAEDIVASAARSYGSLGKPRFSFVREAMATEPYAPLVRRVTEDFDCDEDTEPNDDVSFGYVLTNRRGAWVLRLSMVGPYGVLLRLRDGSAPEVVAGGERLKEDERRLVCLLAAGGVTLIDRDTLLRPVPLTLPNTAPGQVRIYQALFTDTEILPWEDAAIGVR